MMLSLSQLPASSIALIRLRPAWATPLTTPLAISVVTPVDSLLGWALGTEGVAVGATVGC